jgi:hypothetical protein
MVQKCQKPEGERQKVAIRYISGGSTRSSEKYLGDAYGNIRIVKELT